MKRTGWFVGASLFALTLLASLQAELPDASKGVEAARSRQNASTYYVEHIFGRAIVTPNAMETLRLLATEQLKQEALDQLREKTAIATARIPVVNDLADRAVTELGDKIPQDVASALGPEKEICTVQHGPGWVRYVFADGHGEMIFSHGRRAFRLDLSTQINVLRVQAAYVATVGGIAEIKSVRQSLWIVSRSLMERGLGGDIGASLTVFDQVNELLQLAREAAQVLKAIAMLEKISGVWQCEPGSLDPTFLGKTLTTEQLADETIGLSTTHVFLETRVFAAGGVSDEVASGEKPIPFDAFKLQSKTWVRATDDLPLRYEFTPPGGMKQRMEFEYPTHLEITLPECLTKP